MVYLDVIVYLETNTFHAMGGFSVFTKGFLMPKSLAISVYALYLHYCVLNGAFLFYSTNYTLS